MSFVRSREMCLAQFADESGARSASGRWVRADPFEPTMRRFSVGRVRSGKTVGAMAAASRVLGAYPDARVLVFTPFPESYAEIADVLGEKTGPQTTTEAPSAVCVRPSEMPRWDESVDELPAVSITDPDRTGEHEAVARALKRCHDQLADRSRNARTRHGEQTPPVYLIVDEADRLFHSSVDIDLRRFFRRASTSDGPVAIHALAQEANASQLRPVINQFSAIDLYSVSQPRTAQWLFGLSGEDMAFIREAERPSRVEAGDVETDGAEVLQEAAPTGLCYTAEDGWQRVRYPLFTIEAETMLDLETSHEPAVGTEVTS